MNTAILDDLTTLVSFGPRFHGGAGIHAAADWLEQRLQAAGGTVRRHRVALPGWQPGEGSLVRITTPVARVLPSWPMLWSGGREGSLFGRVVRMGDQGLWGDSMTWTRFAVIDEDGAVRAYLHGRDREPAAPQPLPSGSDRSVAHLAIGRADAVQLGAWIDEGTTPVVEVRCTAGSVDAEAVADNLIVDIPGSSSTAPLVLLCAHYDTFYNTVGAYDNGSGTIAVLHLAERFLATPSPRAVRMVFFTAEEWHLGGARALAGEEDLGDIAMAINIDGLGRGDVLEAFAAPERFDAATHFSMADYAARTRERLTLFSRFPPTTGTDDAVFYRSGVPSLFLTFNDLERLHQPNDLPNPGIARNIAWTLGLVDHLIAELAIPERAQPPGIL